VCTADSHECTDFTIAALKLKWKYVMTTLTDAQKLYIIRYILVDIARYSAQVSAQLRSAYLAEAHNSMVRAAQLAVESWDVIINLYPNFEELKAQIRYDATSATDLARVFYGNAPLIAKSLLK